ncbi:Disease resistance-responsive (dirigent-like protein) family protein [Euphorbia peplus]|nr:Disease resistance-responsive (dirigent-like protein) family protein [Euphorbia peplus]
MGKQLLIRFLVIAIAMLNMCYGSSKEIDPWLQNLSHSKEKVTHLHFYLHDMFSGQNPSALQIVKSDIKRKSPTLFGALVMMDDQLTDGPLPTSKEVGRAQGLYGSSGQTTVDLAMVFNLVFTSGLFNGSTLAVVGANQATDSIRELPIIGGTGVFRLARGFASLKTYFYNATNGDAIVEYNVSVIHY